MNVALLFFQLGCVSSLLAVCIGAFGAHALKDVLDTHNMTHTYETGVQYQFYHVPGLFVTSALLTTAAGAELRGLVAAGTLFSVGTVLFSGSLYALAILRVDALGIITPFGGMAFIVAWALTMRGGQQVLQINQQIIKPIEPLAAQDRLGS